MSNGDHTSQLNADQKFHLDDLIASFRMEGMEFSAAEVDVLAEFILGKITREAAFAKMNTLGH